MLQFLCLSLDLIDLTLQFKSLWVIAINRQQRNSFGCESFHSFFDQLFRTFRTEIIRKIIQLKWTNFMYTSKWKWQNNHLSIFLVWTTFQGRILSFRFDMNHGVNSVSSRFLFATFLISIFLMEIKTDTIAPVDLSIDQSYHSTDI